MARYRGLEDMQNLERLRDSLTRATPEGQDLRLVLSLLAEILEHVVEAVDDIDTAVMMTVQGEGTVVGDGFMMNVTRYVPLHQAHELAVRQNEIYEVMKIVEGCGASPELTKAIDHLGDRMRHIQADLKSACAEASR